MKVPEFKKKLTELVNEFNEKNECIITDLRLTAKIIDPLNGKKKQVSYDVLAEFN